MAGLALHSLFFLYLKLADKCKKEQSRTTLDSELAESQLPVQVIQLPVFNENTDMVKTLIDSACSVDYPRNKLAIQLLDDSDKKELSSCLRYYVQQKCVESPDLQLFYLQRKKRDAFKAGNLNFGIEQIHAIQGEFSSQDPCNIIVSIFDADYLIAPDYLTQTAKYFSNPYVGIVQAATTFVNSNKSCLTRAQTVFQDNLHHVEFSGRSKTNHLTVFRGSAGSLRLQTIIDCGYWQGDTQVEDVDLSFTAQCNGWKIIYADHIICPSLLPENYNELKLQQRSWMKGIMEVMRKRLGQILSSKKLTFSQKILGLDFFLILSLQALFMIISYATIIPSYYYWCSFNDPRNFNIFLLVLLALFILTHIPFFVRELKDQHRQKGQNKTRIPSSLINGLYSFGLMIALFIPLSYGLVEGLMGKEVHRDRTGKKEKTSNETHTRCLPQRSINLLKKINAVEIIMSFYSIIFVVWALMQGNYIILLLYSTLAFVYPISGLISYLSISTISR